MTDWDAVNVEDLPATAQELVEVIGLAATMGIVAVRGGARLCVPKQTTGDHWLAERIGMEAFERLTQVYAGEEIEIPCCSVAFLKVRENTIYGQFEQGASIAELALEHGYSERGMRKLIQRVQSRGVSA